MDTYNIKWTTINHKIFRLLCIKTGQTINLREIARELKISPTSASKSLIELEKNSLVKVKKLKKINLLSIELNRDNFYAINLKRVENLKLIYESGLHNFLHNQFPGCTIIIFGSYSRGEDVYFGKSEEHNSDIDIAIIGSKEKTIDLSKFSKFLERTIHASFYESWKDIHKHLKESILNGITLSGGIEL